MTHPLTPYQLTQHWFTHVVLGLNLCPFAHRPARQQQIHFVESLADNEHALLEELYNEIEALRHIDANERETTLLIVPEQLGDFYDYQFFLEESQRLLKREGWLGEFQLASFHPNYCFAGSETEDPSNLTNRSPYPIIHILREASLTKVLENVTDPEAIPETNMATMNNLSKEDTQKLFFYLRSI